MQRWNGKALDESFRCWLKKPGDLWVIGLIIMSVLYTIWEDSSREENQHPCHIRLFQDVPLADIAIELQIKNIPSYLIFESRTSPIAFAIKGGTAFPTRVYCGISDFLLSPPVALFP